MPRYANVRRRGYVGLLTYGLVASLGLIAISAPLTGAGAAFGKSFNPPFKGFVSAADSSSVLGSSLTAFSIPSFLNLSQGRGGFAGVIGANSSSMVVSGLYNSSISWISSSISAYIEVPFHNFSGTRTLSSVNVTLSYVVSGNISLIGGNCPWIKTIHKRNICDRYVDASVGIGPEWMTFLKDYLNGGGVNTHYTHGQCVNSCVMPGSSARAFVDTSNNSTGASNTAYGSSGTTAFSGSGTVSMLFIPSTPIKASHTLVIWLVANGGLLGSLGALAGRGGLSGASVTASIAFSMTLVSVVES